MVSREVDRDYYKLEAVDDAVNEIKLVESVAGDAVAIEAIGSDTNIPLELRPKGTGKVAPVIGNATHHALVYCSRNTIVYTETSNKTLFVLPATAIITDIILDITELFDGTTPIVNVGHTGTPPDDYVDDVAGGTAGMNRCGDGGDMPDAARGSIGSSDVTVLGVFGVASGSPSQGAATIEVYWIMP